MRFRAASWLVVFLAISGCSGGAGPTDSIGTAAVVADTSPADDSSVGSGIGGGPTEESVTFTLDGKTLDVPIISSCPATPGRGLGFGAVGADGLQVGGGFEAGEGRVYVRDSAGVEWNAGTDTALGSLLFTLSDSGGNANPFVTVEAAGEVENEAGDRLEFAVIAICEPGGS